MIQVEIPVPEGSVILITAFEKFLWENNLSKEINLELKK